MHHPFVPTAAASEWRDAAAFVCGEAETSYQEFGQRIEDTAARMAAWGLAPGTVLGIAIPNKSVRSCAVPPLKGAGGCTSADAAVAILAAVRAGLVAWPVNPRFPPDYLAPLMQQAGCSKMINGMSELPDTQVPLPPPPNPLDPAVLVLTSGSGGTPKAAALSQRNLLHAAACANANIVLDYATDGWLLSLPPFHVAGLGIVYRCLLSGAAMVLPQPGEPLLDQLLHPRVTHVSLVATQLHRLLQQPGGADALRRLKAILLGGSAIPPALLDRAAKEGLRIHTSYGMTETAAQITCTRPGEGLEAWRSSGHPLRDGTLRISPAGEIEVSGDSVFLGYWPLSPPLKAAGGCSGEREGVRGGWFPTGDLGHFDSCGRLHVTGRIGNRFVCGGENVQPEEVERALLSLPGVLRARVVAVPDDEYVQVPAAFLEQEAGSSFDGALLLDALRPLLARHALPRYIFPWPAHLERGGEKLTRQQLEEEAARRLAN